MKYLILFLAFNVNAAVNIGTLRVTTLRPIASQQGIIIDPSRTNAGWVQNFIIPDSSSMVVSTNIGSNAPLTWVNAAIAACSSNQVVQLTNGVYTFTNQVLFDGKHGVVLRGAGTNTVLIFNRDNGANFANILIKGPNFTSIVDNGPPNVANWTNGFSQGESNIVLSSVSGLEVGKMITVDQTNDLINVFSLGSEGNCSYCSRSSGARVQQQTSKVMAINGLTVTIWPPLAMPNWSSSMSPQAWWLNGSAPDYATRCGVENLTIDGSASTNFPNGANITLLNAANCWVSNVWSINAQVAHVNSYQSFGNHITHCYIYGTQSAASQSYGYLGSYSHFNYVYNNIFNKVTGPIIPGPAACGSVVAYNVLTNMYYTVSAGWMQAALAPHDGHNCYHLFEANWANKIYGDYIHGSGSHMVNFRSVLTGFEPGKDNQIQAATMEARNRSYSFVGCILGTAGVHDTYQWTNNASPTGTAIYKIGYSNTTTSLTGYDPYVLTTLYRHVNYDVVTDGIVTETTNSYVTLPQSLYLSSKPSWFGNLSWPPYNPTNHSAANTSMTNIPAGYRLVYGVDP